MKSLRLLGALLCLALVTPAYGDASPVPYPPHCIVEPWDTFGHAFMNPGDGCDTDVLRVTVLGHNGEPVYLSAVEVLFDSCPDLCVDPEDSGLTATADARGKVILNPKVGGWSLCSIVVRASGIVLRTYSETKSTDWDGFAADGRVGGDDFAFFATAFKAEDLRADYNGDGVVNGTDFSMFACSYAGPDINPSYPDCE